LSDRLGQPEPHGEQFKTVVASVRFNNLHVASTRQAYYSIDNRKFKNQAQTLARRKYMDVCQLHEKFAAEVRGIDLGAQPPSADVVADIEAAINQYAVLVLRAQSLTDQSQIAFARRLGEIEMPRTHRDKHRLKFAELADISNLDADNQLRPKNDRRRMDSLGNQLWHTDASFRHIPGELSMLLAHVVPPAGGETEFTDLRAAYDALPEAAKQDLAGLQAEHTIWHSRALAGFTDFSPEELAAVPPVQHPLVRVHPGSKRTTLYLASHASHVVGRPLPDGQRLLQDLIAHSTQPQFIYRHHWRVGDLVIWDNRCTMHRGRPHDETHPRDLRRVTTQDHSMSLAS
jgi:alpha-ketoglutarate-dependent 2,4-dichlorophenoxyacetate dioxygenase